MGALPPRYPSNLVPRQAVHIFPSYTVKGNTQKKNGRIIDSDRVRVILASHFEGVRLAVWEA